MHVVTKTKINKNKQNKQTAPRHLLFTMFLNFRSFETLVPLIDPSTIVPHTITRANRAEQRVQRYTITKTGKTLLTSPLTKRATATDRAKGGTGQPGVTRSSGLDLRARGGEPSPHTSNTYSILIPITIVPVSPPLLVAPSHFPIQFCTCSF